MMNINIILWVFVPYLYLKIRFTLDLTCTLYVKIKISSSPHALDGEVERDALREEACRQDAQSQVDALYWLGVHQPANPVVGGESRPYAEDANPGNERGDVLHVRVAVGVVLARVLVGIIDPVRQDQLQFSG
jgi:hypothetical protein